MTTNLSPNNPEELREQFQGKLNSLAPGITDAYRERLGRITGGIVAIVVGAVCSVLAALSNPEARVSLLSFGAPSVLLLGLVAYFLGKGGAASWMQRAAKRMLIPGPDPNADLARLRALTPDAWSGAQALALERRSVLLPLLALALLLSLSVVLGLLLFLSSSFFLTYTTEELTSPSSVLAGSLLAVPCIFVLPWLFVWRLRLGRSSLDLAALPLLRRVSLLLFLLAFVVAVGLWLHTNGGTFASVLFVLLIVGVIVPPLGLVLVAAGLFYLGIALIAPLVSGTLCLGGLYLASKGLTRQVERERDMLPNLFS